MRFTLLLVPLLFAVAGCGSAQSDESANSTYTSEESVPSGEVTERTEETKAGETYDEYDARRDSYNGVRGESHGYGCTVNCGGHDAGYEWASEHGITSTEECGGKSWSFEEGCKAYAEEQQADQGEVE